MESENKLTNAQISNMDWSSLHGHVPYALTNDYMFHAVLQSNNYVLKHLIADLLHMKITDIISCSIMNPIELGKSIKEKTFYLDIKLLLNNYATINLEMQIIDEHNWTDRSLLYLCRNFDSLNRGDDYKNIRPAIHISLLDFPLFPEFNEFFATYYMMNEKTHQKYSDKIRLSVVNLKKIRFATEEDRHYNIDQWAKLFKASTWEELHMLSKSKQEFEEAVATMYRLSQDEQVRMQCEAREEYYRRKNTDARLMREAREEREQAFAEREQAFAERDQAFAEREQAFAERDQANTKLDQANTKLDQANAELDQANAELKRLKEQLAQYQQ